MGPLSVRYLTNLKSVFAYLLCAAFFIANYATPVSASEERLMLICLTGKWQGHRLGYFVDNTVVSDENGISFGGIVISFESAQPKRGDLAKVLFPSSSNEREGTVLYSQYNSEPHIVIEYVDTGGVSILFYNLETDQATLSLPKVFLGTYVDTFIKDDCASTFPND